MKRIIYLLTLPVFFLLSCSNSTEHPDQNWMSKPVDEWPSFVLTNEIIFEDQSFTDFASGFLLKNEQDTFAITSKQLFIAFRDMGIYTIDFKGKLKSWEMYPMDQPELRIRLGELINTDSTELSALPNATNNTDWLVFQVDEVPSGIPILELAEKYPEKGDRILSAYSKPGSGKNAKKMYGVSGSILQLFDNQSFLSVEQAIENPLWITGSPLLNGEGRVFGLVTTVNQQIGQSCSISYFYDVLESQKQKNKHD